MIEKNFLGTAGSPEGLKLVKSLGAKTVVNHRQEGYEQELQKAFQMVMGSQRRESLGFGFILELSAHINLARVLELVAPLGEIAVAGARTKVEIDPVDILHKESKVFGRLETYPLQVYPVGVCGFFYTPETRRQAGLAINALFETGLKPVIDKVDRIASRMRRMCFRFTT